jgi:hypothetical protein
MLIRSLQAENFMKFARLRIGNLPECGVIGIEGPNESGKSTIGEAILFAFFGRSRLAKDCPLEHLIRWGSEHLRVEVEFTIPGSGGGDFLIYREIDRSGTNYVKVLSLPERRELATGNLEVGEFVAQRIRFDFFEFQQAFYHDQYEKRRVDPSLTSFVARMTGAAHMARAVLEVKKEIDHIEREFGHYQRDIGRNMRHIERFDANIAKLPELEAKAQHLAGEQEACKAELARQSQQLQFRRLMLEERERCERRLKEMAALKGLELQGGVEALLEVYDALEKGRAEKAAYYDEYRDDFRHLQEGLRKIRHLIDDYRDLCRSFREAREAVAAELNGSSPDNLTALEQRASKEQAQLEKKSRKLRRGMWVPVAVALAAGSGAVAALLAPWPESAPFASLPAVLACVLVAVLGIGWLLANALRLRALQVREEMVSERLGELREKIEGVNSHIERLTELEALEPSSHIHEFVESARTVARGPTAKKLAEFQSTHARLLAHANNGGAAYSDLLSTLGERERQSRKRLGAAMQADERKLKEQETQLKKARSDRDRVDNEIRECQAQGAKRDALLEKNRELEAAACVLQSEIEDRRTACQLLEETMVSLRSRAGPVLGRFMKGVLPFLTDGRYRDVKVSESLEIQVFAGEKSDFLPAGELSGGTNEGLMLALRLAFSQAFVAARSRQAQFVFLDEPFKMMDITRAISALRMLRELSPELCQLFVIQPNYTEAQRRAFDCLISATVETTELEAGCS